MEYPPIPEPSFNTEKWFTSIFKSNEKSEIDLVNKHNFHLEYHKIRPLISLLDTKNYDTILYEIKNCILKLIIRLIYMIMTKIIRNFKNNRNKLVYKYLLTSKGVKNKTILMIDFLKIKTKEYEELQKELEKTNNSKF